MNSNLRPLLILIIGGAVLWGALKLSKMNAVEFSVDSAPKAEASLPAVHTASEDNFVSESKDTPLAAPVAPEVAPVMGPHLRTMGECLQIQNSLDDSAEASFNALESSLRTVFGNVYENQLDWKNVHLTLPNGEKRRLHFEIEALGEENTATRLRYFGVDSEDLPLPLPLPDDQPGLNPSAELVESLESQGQITLREEAHRATYGNGAEIYYVERNGVLSEVEINFQGNSVKCHDLHAQGSCSCF